MGNKLPLHFLVIFLTISISSSSAEIAQSKSQVKSDSSQPRVKSVRFAKGENYKLIRQKLMADGWRAFENPYLDKSSKDVQVAIKLSKSLGFQELQQCFSRGGNLFSCDITWTYTKDKENPELFFGILIDAEAKKAWIEEDVVSK